MKKFKNKYRTDSMRAQWWDYGWNGAYFITICTKNRRHYFGEIENKKMVLSNVGTIVDLLWHEIPNHSPFVELGEFVVMPNHLHGILILNKPNDKKGTTQNENIQNDRGKNNATNDGNIGNGGNDRDGRDNRDGRDGRDVETLHATSLPTPPPPPTPPPTPPTPPTTSPSTPSPPPPEQNPSTKNQQMANLSPKSGTVSRIIGSYKSSITKHAHRMGFPHEWQSRFYDNIIRNNTAYQRIANYIKNNPKNWKDDKFYK